MVPPSHHNLCTCNGVSSNLLFPSSLTPDVPLISARFSGTGGPPPTGWRAASHAQRDADAGTAWLEYIHGLYIDGPAGVMQTSSGSLLPQRQAGLPPVHADCSVLRSPMSRWSRAISWCGVQVAWMRWSLDPCGELISRSPLSTFTSPISCPAC